MAQPGVSYGVGQKDEHQGPQAQQGPVKGNSTVWQQANL